ncbi:hypothetical protein EDD11_010223 [Mortierella claussenii]|nr:hypothetical protein EDD11_010223 [Mortierella claussenii]
MFGQSNSSHTPGRRGPIALSDDDLVGATGLEWEDLEAQLYDGEIDAEEHQQNEYEGEEMGDMTTARPLKPITGRDRYLDDDEEDEENEGQELSGGVNARYRDDDDDDDDDAKVGETSGEETSEGKLSKSKPSAAQKKDMLFQLEDTDPELDLQDAPTQHTF